MFRIDISVSYIDKERGVIMVIEHSILGVIASRPCTGYDIKTEFEHEGAGMVWGVSFGSVYPKLKNLEEKGLIPTYRTETKGRQKKIFELTPKGWEALHKWLGESPSYPIIKDELLLKLSMWDRGRPEDRQTLIGRSYSSHSLVELACMLHTSLVDINSFHVILIRFDTDVPSVRGRDDFLNLN